MQKPLAVLAALLFVLFSICSCVKPAATVPPAKYTGCRIVQVIQAGVDTSGKTISNFYYNDNGTVKRMYVIQPNYPYSGYNKYFEYKDNFIAIRTVRVGQSAISATDSLILDAQSRVAYIYHTGYYNSYNGTMWDEYRYDSAGNMILHTANQYNTQTTDTFQWQNSDLVRLATDNTSGEGEVYAYTYSDTLYETGNITARLADFVNYGRQIYTSKHLMAGEICTSCYSVVFNYAYTSDSLGNLTYIQEIPMDGATNNLKTSWITYACE